jgi:murein L,D-transpeptidase YcbB/YkuD
MFKALGFLLSLILFFSFAGCATTTDMTVPEPQAAHLENRIQVLEAELKQKQDENLMLKEKIAKLEKVPIKMPTAKDIQIALKNAGFYKGEIDGQIGGKTKEAIRKFQEANKLTPDGTVGSRTWSILSKYLEK